MTAPRGLAALAGEARGWLFGELLPLWSTAGCDPAGGFHDRLDDNARPLARPRRCRVQARQVYVFAEAGRLGWAGDWRADMEHGLRFILERLDRGELFACAVDEAGEADPATDNYEQAFVLFALAKAYAATGDARLRDRALRLVAALRRVRAHPLGGFREDEHGTPPLRANPHMHLLEAALAWMEAGPDGAFLALGRELVGLAAGRLRDPASGAILELFDADWRPLPEAAGSVVEPGHQYEWAWLLLRWRAATGEGGDTMARELYAFAQAHGLDHARGVAINEVAPAGAVRDAGARLWPQTERLKAALAMHELGDPGAAAEAAAAWDGLMRFPLPANRALFRDRMRADGSFDPDPSFASSLYHITCAIAELDRVARR